MIDNGELSQRDFKLKKLKKEIISDSKRVTKLITISLNKGRWPMLDRNKEIISLTAKRQKFLSLLSIKYHFSSIEVKSQIEEWICKLDLRCLAIETVYRSIGNRIPGVDGISLSQGTLQNYLDIIDFKNLHSYKANNIKQVMIPKNSSTSTEKLIGILTIKDRIVQTLFVQLIEPTLDVWADSNSFGFRKGRNVHQALGQLTRSLNKEVNHSGQFKKYFCNTKYVLKTDVKDFFRSIDRDWLMNNFPFPKKFRFILRDWLEEKIEFQDNISTNLNGFPQGSIIGPSLANFILNGLESAIKPSKATRLSLEKKKWVESISMKPLIKNGPAKIIVSNSIVRFTDDFIIVTNSLEEVPFIKKGVEKFLFERGLKINEAKTKIIKWKNNSKFDFLGFTFHYLTAPYLSRITMQGAAVKGGLYVYPSNDSIKIFKAKIKKLIQFNINSSPYKLIHTLNPKIRDWGNYFDVGSRKVFSRLDHFIWSRLMRYLKRKFPKVSKTTLIERYFTGGKNPGNRTWRFHGTLQTLDAKSLKRKGEIVWLLILCQLNSPISYTNIRPNKKLLESSYYVNPEESIKYNAKLMAFRSNGKTCFNSWSQLYNLQRGICPICKQGLGHLLEDSLEIYRKIEVRKLPVGDPLLSDINNLQLVHKTCHKATLKKR